MRALPFLGVEESPFRTVNTTPLLDPQLSAGARGVAALMQVVGSVHPSVLSADYGIPAPELRGYLRELAEAGYLRPENGDTEAATWWFTGGSAPMALSGIVRAPRPGKKPAGDEHDSARLAAFERAVAEAGLRATRQVSAPGGVRGLFARLATMEPAPSPDEVYEATRHGVRRLQAGAWVRFERVPEWVQAWRVDQQRQATQAQQRRPEPLAALSQVSGQTYRDNLLDEE